MEIQNENLDDFARWFKEHPEKILGEVITKKGTKFDKDKEYTTIIGNKESLLSIDVPDYMQITNDAPLISTENEDITETKSTKEQIDIIKTSIIKSKKIVLDKKQNKKSEISSNDNLWSYEEVDETYNGDRYDEKDNLIAPAITLEEKQAYSIYLQNFTGKRLEGGFAKYDLEFNMVNVKALMKKGVLCFDNTEKEDNRKYKPTFFYASGNVRLKKQELIKDKDFYVSNFGEDVYENHLKSISEAVNIVDENKLTLNSPNKLKRISIKMDSEFAETFMVSPIVPINEKSFDYNGSWLRKDSDGNITWKVKELASGIKAYERTQQGYGSYTDRKLSIKDAFTFWLKDFSQWDASNYNIIYPLGVNADLVFNWFLIGYQ